MTKIGILLTNTGTPDAPTTSAVRRYLKEFLTDKRIIQLPRLVWWPILYGFVLTFRSPRSAKLYQKIWTKEGSPMRSIMQNLSKLLQHKLQATQAHSFTVEIGMNYGNPSIPDSLENLRKKQVEKLIILPLYPQYSYTTTASSVDRVKNTLKSWSVAPELNLIQNYGNHHDYIQALAENLRRTWKENAPAEHLLISFHGIPERYSNRGDPYKAQCERTAQMLAEKLQLPKDKWNLCYQSKFGYDQWLKPSTQVLFAELPTRGVKHIDVVCPGFAVDCLETLEEIAIRGKTIFTAAGGESVRYIPALNNSNAHVELLTQLISQHL